MRKRRTRQHVIADLAVNHIERQILLCGFTAQRVEKDYGIDLILQTFDRLGFVENGAVLLQVKATDRPRINRHRRSIAVRVDRADLEWWLRERQPVILIVYNARRDTAIWLYVQAYFQTIKGFDLSRIGRSTTVYVPLCNVVHAGAVRTFARFRDNVLRQQKDVVSHGP